MGADPGNSSGVIVLFLFVLFALAYGLWCCARILGRTGHNRAWALLMIVPVINLALVWVLAYTRWPKLDDRAPPDRNRYGAPPGRGTVP